MATLRAMRALLVALLVGSALAALPARADLRSIASGWNNANITWFDYEDGIKEAQKTGRPIFLLVHTTWCPHCVKYQKHFFDPRVVELSKRYVMVMMDRDIEKALSARIGPAGQNYVPRSMVLKADGAPRLDVTGNNAKFPHYVDYSSPEFLITFMTKGQK